MSTAITSQAILDFIVKIIAVAPTVQGIIGEGITLEQTITALVKGLLPSQLPQADANTIAATALQVHNAWHSADALLSTQAPPATPATAAAPAKAS